MNRLLFKATRLSLLMQQKELAAICGWSYSTEICKFEKGKDVSDDAKDIFVPMLELVFKMRKKQNPSLEIARAALYIEMARGTEFEKDSKEFLMKP